MMKIVHANPGLDKPINAELEFYKYCCTPKIVSSFSDYEG
jgi:hypothetical protein